MQGLGMFAAIRHEIVICILRGDYEPPVTSTVHPPLVSSPKLAKLATAVYLQAPLVHFSALLSPV